MLYLTISDLQPSFSLPMKEWLDLALKSIEKIVTYKKQGKVVIHGGYAGRQAGCIIWDVDSHEELMNLMSQMPFWAFMDWEIFPLLSTEYTLEVLKQSKASM